MADTLDNLVSVSHATHAFKPGLVAEHDNNNCQIIISIIDVNQYCHDPKVSLLTCAKTMLIIGMMHLC